MAPKRIISRLAEHRWWVVVGLLVAQSFAIFALAILSLSQSAANRSQNVDLRVAKSQRVADKHAKQEAAYAACKAAISGTALGNKILGEIRSAFRDLSLVSVSEKVRAALTQHARKLPVFPPPTCDPGPKPKKKGASP